LMRVALSSSPVDETRTGAGLGASFQKSFCKELALQKMMNGRRQRGKTTQKSRRSSQNHMASMSGKEDGPAFTVRNQARPHGRGPL